MKRILFAVVLVFAAFVAIPVASLACPPPPAPEYEGPACGDGPKDDEDCHPHCPHDGGGDIVLVEVVC